MADGNYCVHTTFRCSLNETMQKSNTHSMCVYRENRVLVQNMQHVTEPGTIASILSLAPRLEQRRELACALSEWPPAALEPRRLEQAECKQCKPRAPCVTRSHREATVAATRARAVRKINHSIWMRCSLRWYCLRGTRARANAFGSLYSHCWRRLWSFMGGHHETAARVALVEHTRNVHECA